MNDPTNTLIYEIKNSLPPDSTLKHQVLFPGILLARYRLQGATCTVQHSSWPGLYIFSNGREGSMGWQLNSGKQIYLHRQAFACLPHQPVPKQSFPCQTVFMRACLFFSIFP